jgi:hypothetical protein
MLVTRLPSREKRQIQGATVVAGSCIRLSGRASAETVQKYLKELHPALSCITRGEGASYLLLYAGSRSGLLGPPVLHVPL